RLERIAGVTVSVGTGGMGWGKPVQIQLTGPDAVTLAELAERVADEVRQVPGAVDVGLSTRGQRPQYEIVVDRELASSIGAAVAGPARRPGVPAAGGGGARGPARDGAAHARGGRDGHAGAGPDPAPRPRPRGDGGGEHARAPAVRGGGRHPAAPAQRGLPAG